ncbi:hypothetical protein [Variovorax sp. LjRoot178]|uniref:hypothetical protein n=1 Tax=Variovorax sp. LjRoot178 TaxID=3342277 RepID=UPI003ECF2CA6
MINPIKSLSRLWRRPRPPSGNVYYVRLATPHGTLYKLGFTKMPSVTERLAYGGLGNERLIDKVLAFEFLEDAWDVEQDLHDHFQRQRAFGGRGKNPAWPLNGCGQTELYRDDILGIDEDVYEPRVIERLPPVLTQKDTGCLAILIALVLAPFTLGISLIFLFLGLADIFDPTSVKPTSVGVTSGEFPRSASRTTVTRPRPNHPKQIKDLVAPL